MMIHMELIEGGRKTLEQEIIDNLFKSTPQETQEFMHKLDTLNSHRATLHDMNNYEPLPIQEAACPLP